MIDDDIISLTVPVVLELTMVEMEAINRILRIQIDEEQNKNRFPYDLVSAFIHINRDFHMAGGMMSPTFEAYIR